MSFSKYIEKLENWDIRLFLSLYNSDFSKRTKNIAKIFSFLGSFYLWGGIWLLWFIYGYITKDYYLLVIFTGGFDQSIIIHSFIRYRIIRRNRPYITLESKGVKRHDDFIGIPYLMSKSEQKSFPSGHVTFFLFFGILFTWYFNNIIIFIIFFCLDIVIAISRLICGVHFPVDVIFGFIFAFGYALLYLGLTFQFWVDFYYWIGPIFSRIFNFWQYL